MIDAQAKDRIITARVQLLINQPFFGTLSTRLLMENADSWCSKGATDGRKLYYNSAFICRLRPEEVLFFVGHEVLHCVYDHIGRFGDRNKQIAGIAADYVVNTDLVEYGIGSIITTIPILYDRKYLGWSFEQVYEDLYKDAEKSISECIGKLLDEHLESGAPGNELSAEEQQTIRDEITEAILSAAETAGAGKVPAGVKRLLGQLNSPKMNWRELIQQEIQSSVKSDYSWMRMSRRGWYSDAILPGMLPGTRIKITVAVDLSGSITDKMVKEFFSEIYGIMCMYSEYEITVWTFDTVVHRPQTFTEESSEEFLCYEPKGGGGTLFECNWRYMKETELVPDKLIMLTDGEPCDSWGDPNYCDVIWIIHNQNKTIVPPYGVTAYYNG